MVSDQPDQDKYPKFNVGLQLLGRSDKDNVRYGCRFKTPLRKGQSPEEERYMLGGCPKKEYQICRGPVS